MRTVIILALLVLTQAHAAEPYPEHAGVKYPVEHWRLVVHESPCAAVCKDSAGRTIPGFESYSRKSCVRKGIEKMEALQDVPVWVQDAVTITGFQCVFVYEEDVG